MPQELCLVTWEDKEGSNGLLQGDQTRLCPGRFVQMDEFGAGQGALLAEGPALAKAWGSREDCEVLCCLEHWPCEEAQGQARRE